MCVLSDGIGDRDIPGATAKQLVDVSIVFFFYHTLLVSVVFLLYFWGGGCVVVEGKFWE